MNITGVKRVDHRPTLDPIIRIRRRPYGARQLTGAWWEWIRCDGQWTLHSEIGQNGDYSPPPDFQCLRGRDFDCPVHVVERRWVAGIEDVTVPT